LSEPAAVATRSAGSEEATRVQVNTTPGMVMGTASYMSPEQARGKVTDARTDLWSLGVVLYEMLSGKIPFTGETVNHTIVSILEREPMILENVPAELQRIVRKSMTKDVDMRYQTAHDLLIDLKNLRRDLDIQGELERSIIPNRAATTESAKENQTPLLSPIKLTTRSSSSVNTIATSSIVNRIPTASPSGPTRLPCAARTRRASRPSASTFPPLTFFPSNFSRRVIRLSLLQSFLRKCAGRAGASPP